MNEDLELYRAHDHESPFEALEQRRKVLNEFTGRMVYESEYNTEKRQEYYDRKEKEAEAYIKKLADQHGLDEDEMRRAISNRDNNPLQVLGTADVAQELDISQGVARDRMRRGVIHSYEINGRYYCHAYVIADIRKRAPEIIADGGFKNLYADIVYKHDMEEPWRKSNSQVQKGSK